MSSGAISVHQQLRPYRRPSDNRVCLSLQWVIFLWCAIPLVQLAHLGQPALAINVELIGVTVAVFAWAVRCALADVRAELLNDAHESAIKIKTDNATTFGSTTIGGGSVENKDSGEQDQVEDEHDIEVALASGQATEA